MSRDINETKFSFEAFRKLKKGLGEFDAVVECNEMAIREFLKNLKDSHDQKQFIQDLSQKHGVRVDKVSIDLFSSRIRLFYILSVMQRAEQFFEVMRDFRKGGLNPVNYNKFIGFIDNLPPINQRTLIDFQAFDSLGLTDLTEADLSVIMREVIKRATEKCKTCWHPLANNTSCNIDGAGNIISSAAHSIQNNGVLSQIAEDGHVFGYVIEEGQINARKFGKNMASIFWGFCNTHDAIFRPIETEVYTKTDEQHFLFAYRGFIVSMHKKLEGSNILDYGNHSDNDILENKKLFDHAILISDYSSIETFIIELPVFYPIACSTCFYLDYDYVGNMISHSDERMEYIFVTLLPDSNKTFFY